MIIIIIIVIKQLQQHRLQCQFTQYAKSASSSSVNFTQNKNNNNSKGDGKKKSGKATFCCFCFVVAVFFLVYLLFLPVYFGISSHSLSLYLSFFLSLANSSHCTRTRSICSHIYTHAHIKTVRRTHTNVNTRAVGYTSLSAKQEQRIKQCGHTACACVCNGINISCSCCCC